MIDIPLNIKIPICIEQGSVFNFFMDFHESKRDSKNRYFVILNSSPKTDSVLIMVTSTKQIQKRFDFVKRAGISESTLVKVTSEEYNIFTQDSLFDCNYVFELSMNDLVRKIEEKGSMNYPKMNSAIITNIINGVKDSPLVTEDIKMLL